MSGAGSPSTRILRYGEARLRQRCCAVAQDEGDVAELADRLWQALLRHDGVGLSAPQVGDLRRVVVLKDVRQLRPAVRLVLVNPELVDRSGGRSVYDEGCLSFPGLYLRLARPTAVTVRYRDLGGSPRQLTDDGLLARAIQHEVDHLDGVLYIDHLTAWRRRWLWWRLRRLAGPRGEPIA